MLFKAELARKIFEGGKTQTRRIVKAGEYAIDENNAPTVHSASGRVKWAVGREQGVKTKRTGHSIGKVKILRLWSEDICDIAHEDIMAEGFANADEFWKTWQEINGKHMNRVRVWAVEFEPIAKVGDSVVFKPMAKGKASDFSLPDDVVGKLVWASGTNELWFDPCIAGTNPFFVHPDNYCLAQ